jgi:transcriptional regulator with XRE-family HTH domain
MTNSISEKIRLLRLEKNYSLEYVAAQLEISQSYYGRIENGKRTISVYCLIKILSILEVDHISFFNNVNLNQSSEKKIKKPATSF